MNKLNNKSGSSAQAGFTLIELIVVIVILGILAATALPKFTSLAGDARLATLKSAKGSMSAAAALAHGKYLVNSTATPLATLSVEGNTITFATVAPVTGYPKADAGFAGAAGLTDDYTVLAGVNAVTTSSPAVAANEVAIIPKSLAGNPAGLTCYVKYIEATAVNTAPTYSALPTAAACE